MSHSDATSKSHPHDGDAEVLALAEGLVAALGETFDRDGLETLRGVVDSYPTLGQDGAGQVVASLIGLLDDLTAGGQQDREALKVHVRAWRFMVAGKSDPAERARIIEGLGAVRALYAANKAA